MTPQERNSMDIIANRVMQSIQLNGIRNHDPVLAESLLKLYGSSSSRSYSEPLIPAISPWWGSREQIVFLQVMSILLNLDDNPSNENMLSLREEQTVTVDLYAANDNRIYRALLYCPGPWSKNKMKFVMSNCHDDLSLVSACILVCAKWCMNNQCRLINASERIHARMAGRIVSWKLFGWPSSINDVRKALVAW